MSRRKKYNAIRTANRYIKKNPYKPLKWTNGPPRKPSPPSKKRSNKVPSSQVKYAPKGLLPPVQYKVVASGSHSIEQEIIKTPKINQPLFVVLAVVSLVVLIPMMAGGTIALAAALSSEDHYATTPDDANGYRVIGSSTDSTNYNCAWRASSLPTSSQSQILTFNSVNYTKISNAWATCNNVNDYLEISVPPSVIPNPDNFTMSKFSFTMINHQNWHTNLAETETTTFDFDINVNGTTVIYRNEYTTFAGKSNGAQNNQVHFHLGLNITPTTSEILDFNNEVGKCWPYCTVSVNLSDYKATGSQRIPWSQGASLDVQTVVYTTDPDTAGVVLTVAPYFLALVNILVALGSTSFWNPVFGSLKKKAGAY